MKRNLATAIVAGGLLLLGAGCQAAGSLGSSSGDGSYQVGTDIQPGTYHTNGVGKLCYADTTDASGTIINQEVQHGPVTFVINPAAKIFKTSGCGTWKPSDASVTKDPSTFGDGSYQVGVDVQAGTYHTNGAGDLCYADTTDASGAILDQEVQHGPVTFVIDPGANIFKSSGCGTWTKR
jgi:hypothetical protein